MGSGQEQKFSSQPGQHSISLYPQLSIGPTLAQFVQPRLSRSQPLDATSANTQDSDPEERNAEDSENGSPSPSRSVVGAEVPDLESCAVTLRNVPQDYSRDMVSDMLNREGFDGTYDFLYLPFDFK